MATVRVGRDPGIGDGETRRALQAALEGVHASTASVDRLNHLIDRCAPSYLDRWIAILSGDETQVGVEYVSRALGAHLLDVGFSPEQLHRSLLAMRGEGSAGTTVNVFEAATSLVCRPRRNFRVFIPMQAIPRGSQEMPVEWLDPLAARGWIEANASEVSVRHNGGFVFEINALDSWGAVEQATDFIESLSARVAVGLPGDPDFRPFDKAVVAGSHRTYPMTRPRRQVDVHALYRQGALFAVDRPGLFGRLRSALELLAPLERGAPGAAVAGGWAAIEALLKRPDCPNVKAADELALLVACSFPRAELTTLAFVYAHEHDDDLAMRLRHEASNRDRCVTLASALAVNEVVHFSNPSDAAAAGRMKQIVLEPKATLGRVREYAGEAFRRLYRQRNLVLHAGTTDSVAMTSTLRTAPPLVGAGVDRIVHAALEDPEVTPYQLVARGAVELELVGQESGRHIADLLTN